MTLNHMELVLVTICVKKNEEENSFSVYLSNLANLEKNIKLGKSIVYSNLAILIVNI